MTPQGQHDGFGSIGFVPVLKRWWWLLIISAVIAGVCAYFITRSVTPTYESKTSSSSARSTRTSTRIGPHPGTRSSTHRSRRASRSSTQRSRNRVSRERLSATDLEGGQTVTADPTPSSHIRVRTDEPAVSQQLADKLADNLMKLTSTGATTRPEGQPERHREGRGG